MGTGWGGVECGKSSARNIQQASRDVMTHGSCGRRVCADTIAGEQDNRMRRMLLTKEKSAPLSVTNNGIWVALEACCQARKRPTESWTADG